MSKSGLNTKTAEVNGRLIIAQHSFDEILSDKNVDLV